MMRISTVNGHERMSTQALLQAIAQAVANGETDFHIKASGQHDIGGPLWNPEGRPLHFSITNPGQRVGSMCLPGTYVTVDGSAPADAGWLNSGGIISIKGDAGDTAGHCAAAGKIYIGGRAGTRSGSLMKHDPDYEEPELWVLKSTGSFSFEFMGGGKAIICGYDSLTLPSVLGERPCVGMVGGTVYFRGSYAELPDDVAIEALSEEDKAWLDAGLDQFLEHIGQPRLKRELSLWKHWHKLVPHKGASSSSTFSMRDFRNASWPDGGIFADIVQDDLSVEPLVGSGAQRLRAPVWTEGSKKCSDCKACLLNCPQGAIKRRQSPEKESADYAITAQRCIGCGICGAVCPAGIWKMQTLE